MQRKTFSCVGKDVAISGCMESIYESEQNRLNVLSGKIIGGAIQVHTALGPGMLESAYEACLLSELEENQINVQSQVELPAVYKGNKIDAGYRIDLLVENSIIVELKAVEKIRPIHMAQILSYLKLGELSLGLLLDFNVPHLKDGIRRIVNKF